MKAEIFNLNLVSPIYYSLLEKFDPFTSPDKAEASGSDEERVFCFDLDEGERLSFEPDEGMFLRHLVFGGVAVADKAAARKVSEASGELAELPGGNYLFSQKREVLSKEGIIALAVEIQKEGLWQRLKLREKLYLRYLFEDGSWVTQVFRGYDK